MRFAILRQSGREDFASPAIEGGFADVGLKAGGCEPVEIWSKLPATQSIFVVAAGIDHPQGR